MSEGESSGKVRPERRDPDRRSMAGAEYMGLGLQFGVSIIVFMFLGLWLDRKLGTYPWLLVAGVFLGAGSAFYVIYRRLMADQRRITEERKATRAAGDAGGRDEPGGRR